jgi:hypothetical protein
MVCGIALGVTVLEKAPASMHRTCEDHLRCKYQLERTIRCGAVAKFVSAVK